jgi:hypothetical protein
VDFELKRVQPYTRRNLEPPNPDMGPNWADRIRTWNVGIGLDRSSLSPATFRDPAFWYVGFHDEDEHELLPERSLDREISLATSEQQRIRIEREFDSDRQPATWTVWPKSRSMGWLRKVKGLLDASSRIRIG